MKREEIWEEGLQSASAAEQLRQQQNPHDWATRRPEVIWAGRGEYSGLKFIFSWLNSGTRNEFETSSNSYWVDTEVRESHKVIPRREFSIFYTVLCLYVCTQKKILNNYTH